MTSLNYKNKNMDSTTVVLKLTPFLPYKIDYKTSIIFLYNWYQGPKRTKETYKTIIYPFLPVFRTCKCPRTNSILKKIHLETYSSCIRKYHL